MKKARHRWTIIRPSKARPGRVEMIIAPGDRGRLGQLTPHGCFSWAKQLISAAEKALLTHPSAQKRSIGAIKAIKTRRRRRAGRQGATTRQRR